MMSTFRQKRSMTCWSWSGPSTWLIARPLPTGMSSRVGGARDDYKGEANARGKPDDVEATRPDLVERSRRGVRDGVRTKVAGRSRRRVVPPLRLRVRRDEGQELCDARGRGEDRERDSARPPRL